MVTSWPNLQRGLAVANLPLFIHSLPSGNVSLFAIFLSVQLVNCFCIALNILLIGNKCIHIFSEPLSCFLYKNVRMSLGAASLLVGGLD